MSADSPAPGSVPPAPAAPPETPRKRSRARVVLVSLAVLVVLAAGVVAFLPAILSAGFVREAILSWLADNVDRKVEFTKLTVSWSEGIRLEGLRVGDSTDPRTALLEAPLVELDAPVLPLLAKRVLVEKFVIRDAVVHVAARGADSSNVEGVVKTKKRRHKAPAAPKPAQPAAPPQPEEEAVLPEINVPIEVRNLTIVYRDRSGREARQTGIAFTGRIDTRGGPTTYDLSVPCGAGGGLRVSGGATLVDADGTLVAADKRKADVVVELRHVDAATNRDFLALLLGDTPASGVLDGKVVAHLSGADVKSEIDLHVSRLGYGAAAKAAASKSGDDLALSGTFEKTGDMFRVAGWKIRADGVALDADLAGGIDALEGKATLDVDLARVEGALRAAGVEFTGSLAGKLTGSIQFEPSKGVGDFALTGFRGDGFVAGSPPVVVDSALIRFETIQGKDGFELKSLDVKLPDLTASLRGKRAADGALDASADVNGDLGGLIARVRDLGLAPAGLAVNGSIDARVHVAGKPDALVVEVARLALTSKEATIEASGTRAADGSLDVRASGSGDLGAVLGRARAAGAGPQGLENIKARFAFEASAKGPPNALAVDVPKLRLDGDLNLDADGKLAADGAVEAHVRDLSARVDDLLVLAKRLGFLDRDVSLGGRLAVVAEVKGTREKPEIPRATIKLTGGPITADVNGSVDSAGAVKADAEVEIDLASAAAAAKRAGFLTNDFGVVGHATVEAKAAGTRDKIEIPSFHVVTRGAPVDVNAVGRYDASGVSATADVVGNIDRVVQYARSQGWMKRDAAVGGSLTLHAVASGPVDKIAVSAAHFETSGPLRVVVDARMDAARAFAADGKISGTVQPLLDLAAAWSGEEAKRLDGTIDGSFVADGAPDRFAVHVPSLAVRAGGVKIDVDATRAADGAAGAHAKIVGRIPDLVSLAAAFGVATDVEAAGDVDAEITGSLAGAKVEASLSLVATELAVVKPKIGDGPFREPRLSLSIPSAKYDLDRKTLEPVKATLDLDGAHVEATARRDADVVSLDGSIAFQEKFAKNHADLLSGASFQTMSGTFQFDGDVSKGREGASGWKGGFVFDAAGVTAPHVTLSTAKFTGKLADGSLVVDPIDAVMNGGPIHGAATVGLVGDAPRHHLTLTGKDVAIDADLAPLVAHASPLFAIGEEGKTGGKASIDLDLSAKGFDAATLKKSMTGKGTVGLDGAYVQSTNWIGELMQFLGGNDRIEIKRVSIPFKVHDSMVDTGEIPVECVGLSIRLGGHVGFDAKIDYALRVKTTKGGGPLEKFATLFDKEGYLPLRLTGTLSKPKLKLPDLKDVLKGGLGGLFGK